MSFSMFNALIFKSWCLCKRKYLSTLIGIIWPNIILFFIIYSVNSQKQRSVLVVDQEEIIFEQMNKNVFKSLPSPLSIVYTPKNDFTEKIMSKIKKNNSVIVLPLKTEAEIERWFIDNRDFSNIQQQYGIIFNIPSNITKPPQNFSYTIRWMNNYVSTDSLFPETEIPGPMEAGYVYFSKGFFGLKTSLDDTFLREVGANEVNWTVQEFPYPQHKKHDSENEISYNNASPLVVFICFISLWTTAATLSSEERLSGIIERMKMFGMSDTFVVFNYLIHSSLRQFIATLLFTILLKVPINGSTLMENSNFFFIWIILLFICLHSTTHCLAIASFFNNAIVRQLVLSLSYIYTSLWILNSFMKSSFSVTTLIFGDLLAPFSLVHIIRIAVGLELKGGITFDMLLSSETNYHDLPLIAIILCMICGSVLNVFLYIYMLNVKPGPYGSAKPIYYIFPKKCLSLLKISCTRPEKYEHERGLRSGLYESVPDHVEVGINIVNLYKKFGDFTSVKNLSLNVYMGQITALLGHNGAGKTTTLSMLSGMLSPTSGSAFYQGYNIFTNLKAFRKVLGLCPQNNLLHMDLSVLDQLIFFGMQEIGFDYAAPACRLFEEHIHEIKGLSRNDAKAQAETILNEVGLFPKKNVEIQMLSGGMQRKLCIALAMIGKPKVVILDEPTSGLDLESRREIWNILLKSRGERMMLITTHFMEEADALGDQIAIMNHGEISCYGTPLFLKKQYGAGYHVTISYSNVEKYNNIFRIISSRVPESTVINESEEWVKFNLPFIRVKEFPLLFKSLETNEELGISRIGINCTTMEDVFLKVQEEAGAVQPTSQPVINGEDDRGEQMYGIRTKVYIERFLGLVIKNMYHTFKRWFLTLLILGIVPIIVAYLAMDPLDKYISGKNDTSNLYLDLNIYGPTEVLVFGNNHSGFKNAFLSLIQRERSSYVDVTNTSKTVDNIMVKELLKAALADERKFRKSMIVAADFSRREPNFLYSSTAKHAPIIALNLLYNTILQSNNDTSNYSIRTSNYPINSLGFCGNDGDIELISAIAAWVGTLPFGLFIVCSTFIKFVHEERISSVKHLILMTDISPISYWASFFIWDIALYLFSVSLVLITFVIMDSSGILSANDGISLLLLIFFLFGLSMIWLTYFLTFFFKTSIRVTTMYYSIIFTIGLIGFGICNLIAVEYQDYANVLNLHPVTAIMVAMLKFITTAILKLKCSSCPPDTTKNINCSEILQSSYFKELNNSLIYLATAWLLYFLLIILKDIGFFSLLWNELNSKYVGNIETSSLRNIESDVAKEKDRVDAARNLTDDDGAPVVIVDGLAKKFSRSMTAVYDVSFACKEGECFGLLGVNGAGKTTTFNILSGMIPATQGNALIKGYSLKQYKRKCLSFMGYCPQFSALIDDLTGKQMLTLFAKLRLVPSQNVNALVNKWINLLGLEEYCNTSCGVYSGGNKKKLSTALAFIGGPPIILLDEPSSGVDPMFRRNLWDVINGNTNTKQAIIISSHSMDECEAVCDRLTIMAKGRMQCIGNVQHLKSLYGQGYIIMIKLGIHSEKQRDSLKAEMTSIFKSKCVLKDEHQVLLHYHIENNVYKLSELFGSMENLKKRFDIVDDYIINDSSLEQVFLSFAKETV